MTSADFVYLGIAVCLVILALIDTSRHRPRHP